ncbi:MAG: nitric oxide reductase transcriptional regulator NorR [Candidatus Binatia bacterium]
MEEATSSSDSQRTDPEPLLALLDIARDLTASLAASDRYERLLQAVRRAIPADAACLLRLDGEQLVPLASHGLLPETRDRRFDRRQNPRLDIILRSSEPVLFPSDSPLADPFDGLVAGSPRALDHIHACLGCALTDRGEVVGALTADALEPRAFDNLDQRFLATLGALAGAALRTTALIETLESSAAHRGQVARELIRAGSGGGQIVGTSAALRRLLEEIALVARSDLAVLITGETGVGKELVAHRIHESSARREEALIHVNCAALPESIAESELFGHVAGSYTGAHRDRAGKFEIAAGGTLFLDEIGELPLSLQPKLLRVLQTGEIQRVGSDRVHRVDVRVIAATNRDLEQEVARGRFRADLFHRLAAFPLHVPPLRERREDVPLLASHFADIARRRLGIGRVRISADAQERLLASDWPGNVRELENVLSRAVLRASAGAAPGATVTVEAAHLDLPGRDDAATSAPHAAIAGGAASSADAAGGAAPSPLRERVDRFQREQILRAVERHGGSWAAAARDLGLHRANLHHLAQRLGIKPK